MNEADFIPPQGVREAAKRGLKRYEEGHAGDGLTGGAVRRARSLAAGERQSRQQIKRMRAWFARHSAYRDSANRSQDEPTPHEVSWDLWGGSAGRSWSERIGARLDAEGGG